MKCASGESWWAKVRWEYASAGLPTKVPRTGVAGDVEEQAGAEDEETRGVEDGAAEAVEVKAGAEGEEGRDVEGGAGREGAVCVEVVKSWSVSGMVVVEDVERARPRGGGG